MMVGGAVKLMVRRPADCGQAARSRAASTLPTQRFRGLQFPFAPTASSVALPAPTSSWCIYDRGDELAAGLIVDVVVRVGFRGFQDVSVGEEAVHLAAHRMEVGVVAVARQEGGVEL